MEDMPMERTVKANVWTAAYSLDRDQIRWIADEAKRKGISRSKFLRDTLDEVMKRQRKEDAA